MLYTLTCVYVYNTKNMTRRKLYQHMNNSDFMGIKTKIKNFTKPRQQKPKADRSL